MSLLIFPCSEEDACFYSLRTTLTSHPHVALPNANDPLLNSKSLVGLHGHEKHLAMRSIITWTSIMCSIEYGQASLLIM